MTENNMQLYEQFRAVPADAKKEITAGRLKGFTDINPMWRIKKLTEAFGPAGKGWYTEILSQHTETGPGGEAAVFVDLNLYVKYGDEWSRPIFGTGGSKLVSKEKSGLYFSDEAFKMAYTDALSVAFKALGGAADVYYEKDRTKYTQPNENEPQGAKQPARNAAQKPKRDLTDDEILELVSQGIKAGYTSEKLLVKCRVAAFEELTTDQYLATMNWLEGKIREKERAS